MSGTDHSVNIAPERLPQIVLVRPQMGENIGAAARAMWNFGLEHMVLVNPRDGWPNPQANALASGAARVLDQVFVKENLGEAVASSQLVLATTARKRDLTKAIYSPKEAMTRARVAIESGQTVSILFGPERAGMENEDLAHAGGLVSIPVNPAFGSLNLAQAVLLLAYEWRLSADDALGEEMEWASGVPASQGEKTHLYQSLAERLDALGFFWPEKKAAAMRLSLQNMFSRLPLSDIDVRTFHGIFKALNKGTPFQNKKSETDE